MTLNIEKETTFNFDFDDEKLIKDVVCAALDYAECPYEVELNVILTSNEEIALINSEYRNIDAPTDVLSFPMIDYQQPGMFDDLENCDVEDYFNPETGELMLGDIIISVEKVAEQAEKYGHSKQRELGFLVAHSMLHLFGYDHEIPEDAKLMETKQNEILNLLNLKRPNVQNEFND